MDKVIAGIERFRREVFPRRRALFESLRGGQQPGILLVTCSDSRIDPALVTQTEPGELFVVRNAGNLVPPFDAGAGGEAATIEYGIRALGIQHVVVCGHSQCGAMQAVANPETAAGLQTVSDWLAHAAGALEAAEAFDGVADPALRVVAGNVLTQIAHLRTHPAVAEAEADGRLQLHGWVYRFDVGEVAEVDAGGRLVPLGARSHPIRATA